MAWAGFTMQKTQEAKGPDAPNNLFEPVEGGPVGPQGSMSSEARSWSLYTWWETHPVAHWAGRALAVAGSARWRCGPWHVRTRNRTRIGRKESL